MSIFLSLYLMRRLFALSIILAYFITGGCTSGGGGVKQSDRERCMTVLSTVPSDAICVGYAAECGHSGMILDSTSIFHGIGVAGIRGAGMAISQCFNGKVVPILSIAPVPVRFKSDTGSVFNAVLSAAARKGLRTLFVPDSPSLPDGTGVILVSPSDVQLKASERHIKAGRSILDLESLKSAVDSLSLDDETIVLRNSGAGRLVDRSFLGGRFRTSDVGSFLNKAAEWTFFSLCDRGVKVRPYYPDKSVYYARFISSMQGTDSRVGKVLPSATTFALALAVPSEEFRSGYEKYVDANVRMVKYQSRIKNLAGATGKSPLKWEKELAVKEIATVGFDAHRVVLLRIGKKIGNMEPFANEYQGFTGALYGTGFALADDSFSAVRNGWMAIGDKESVNAWYSCEFENNGFEKWPSRNVKCSLFSDGRCMVWNNKGIEIWNSNL